MQHTKLTIKPGQGLSGLSLGLHRDRALQFMLDSAFGHTADDTNLVELDPENVELWFDTADFRLRQIRIADESIRSGRGRVIGQSLPDALLALGFVMGESAWWRLDFEPPIGMPLADSQYECPANPPAELLLSSGTLWIPSLSLGLIMQDGVVSEVVMQGAADMPQPAMALLTPRHREMAKQPDLPACLRRWSRRRASFVVRVASWLFLALQLGQRT